MLVEGKSPNLKKGMVIKMLSFKGKKRILSIFMSAVFILSMAFMSTPATANDYKAQIEDLNSKYEQLEEEQKEINQNLADAKNELEETLAEKKYIESQIANTYSQIEVLSEKISILEGEIADKQQEIADTKADIEETYALFVQRLRAMYMTGESTTMGLLLGADSFSEFLTHMEVVGRIAEHDTEILEYLVDMQMFLEETEAGLQNDMAELDQSKLDMEAKQAQLSGQKAQVEDQIQDLNALESQFKSDAAALAAQLEQVQDEIDEIYALIQSEGDYIGGILAWPVPGFATVTSDFGWRFGGSDYHTGIDIAGWNSKGVGVNTQNIVAANSGKVVMVQNSYVQGYGYGKYVIIDHGGGVSTLYGHCSSINVSIGQTVSRGETIAKVGSTGWSTGPHLHFEVRVDGKYTNPWPYLG